METFKNYLQICQMKKIQSINFKFLKKNMTKRICVLIDDDVDKKLRFFQATWIRKNRGSCSYSRAMNHVLRKYVW